MKINITDNRKISEIQKEFSEHFPFLKLEFFLKQPGKKGGIEKYNQIDNNKKISESRKIHKKEHITITQKQTVAELETAFKENYGLVVQIFRKSGKMWLQSTITDGWTLKEQNEHGESLSNFNTEKKR